MNIIIIIINNVLIIGWHYHVKDVLNVLCAQLTRDLFAIAKLLLFIPCGRLFGSPSAFYCTSLNTQYRIVSCRTMERQQEIICDLSNGVISKFQLHLMTLTEI